MLRPCQIATSAFAALAVLFAACPALAAMNVIPAHPTEADQIYIRLSGEWRNSCVPMASSPPAVIAQPGSIKISTFNPSQICAQVITPFEVLVPLPPLSRGNWIARWYHTPADLLSTRGLQGSIRFHVSAACPSFRPELGDSECGPDVSGDNRPALNFTGGGGAGGKTWIAVYDQTPTDDTTSNVFGSVELQADLQIRRFNNKKGVGLLALYNSAPGSKALALLIYDSGNTDTLVLATVDQVGTIVPLRSVALCLVPGVRCRAGEAGIQEDEWYHLAARVTVTGLDVTIDNVTVQRVSDGQEIDQVPAALDYDGPLPDGVDPTGEVGAVASAFSAVVDSSVADFAVTPQ